jgi:hypothetical protein
MQTCLNNPNQALHLIPCNGLNPQVKCLVRLRLDVATTLSAGNYRFLTCPTCLGASEMTFAGPFQTTTLLTLSTTARALTFPSNSTAFKITFAGIFRFATFLTLSTTGRGGRRRRGRRCGRALARAGTSSTCALQDALTEVTRAADFTLFATRRRRGWRRRSNFT